MSNLSWIAIPVAALGGAIGTGLLIKRYSAGTFCYEKGRLDGKVAIVTGSNTGIGLETAGELVRRGCTVIMACRNMEKTQQAKDKILSMYAGENYKRHQVNDKSMAEDYTEVKESQLIPMKLDLSNLKSVTQFVQEFTKSQTKCDLLVCNAGVMMCPYEETADGFEMQMGTNHLGHCLLVELLTGKLEKSSEPRVVMVSSLAHRFYKLDIENFMLTKENYNSALAYSNSKTANALYAKHLSGRNQSSKLVAYSLHPGAVRTELQRHLNIILRTIYRLGFIFSKSPWEGSQTTIFCCLAPKEKLVSGGYYADCKLAKCSEMIKDQLVADKFILNSLTRLKETPSCKDLFA